MQRDILQEKSTYKIDTDKGGTRIESTEISQLRRLINAIDIYMSRKRGAANKKDKIDQQCTLLEQEEMKMGGERRKKKKRKEKNRVQGCSLSSYRLLIIQI
mgnify:CR=1 FL=1